MEDGKQPTPEVRKQVYERCGQQALRLKGGDSKSLDASGFATSRGRELLPGCTYLPSAPKDTVCYAASGKPVKVSRPGRLGPRKWGYLWRVSDLESLPALSGG